MSEGYHFIFFHYSYKFDHWQSSKEEYLSLNEYFGQLKWDPSHHHKVHDGLPSIHHKTLTAAAGSKHDELLLKCKMSRGSSGFLLGLSVFCQRFDNFGIQGLWPRSVSQKIGCNCQKEGRLEKRAHAVIEFESFNFCPCFPCCQVHFSSSCFCKYSWRGHARPKRCQGDCNTNGKLLVLN